MDILCEQDRQKAIDELQHLGMFNQRMLLDVWQRCVAVGFNPGSLRIAVYQQWKMEVAPLAEEQQMSDDEGVLMGLLCRFDLYGLGYLVDDALEVGVELTYARFLEAAFQWATKIGEAHHNCIGRLTWKNVYLTLKAKNWRPAGF